MEFASQNLVFVLIFSKHSKLGTIVLPYWAKRSSKPYLSISERLSSFNVENYREVLPTYALEIIKAADELTDSNLMKRFVTKKHPVKNFFQSVEGEYFAEFIRPHIEKQIDCCSLFIVGNSLLSVFRCNSFFSSKDYIVVCSLILLLLID